MVVSKLISRAKIAVPKVSAICITYRRHRLLEEAIECFLRQDYPNKELIVLSDEEGVTLKCDAPGVFVHNRKSRSPNIGNKRNEATRLSNGEYILCWDDDDIYLPNRMSYTVKALQQSKLEFLHFRQAAYCNASKCTIKDMTIGPNVIYTRRLFERVGGYTEMDSGEDQDLCKRFRRYYKSACFAPPVPKDEIFYMYRWGVFPHLSTNVTLEDHRRATDAYFKDSQKGVIDLKPQWHQDYTDVTSARVRPENLR
jgi:glycosyltransferase involved in cell wall biosynthesis